MQNLERAFVALATALILIPDPGSAAYRTDAAAAPARTASAPAPDPVVAAAGDVACDPTNPAFNGGAGRGHLCRHKWTGRLLDRGGYDRVLGLGDMQYDEALLRQFRRSYDLWWGGVKDITSPAPGNHEYWTPGARGYWDYYGKAAGRRGRGWYSFDLGTWHLIALNSNCTEVKCTAKSAQVAWLRKDLAASSSTCTLAYWHSPRWSSGPHGSDPAVGTMYRLLYRRGAEVLLAGHDHNYERFAPLNPKGRRDRARGIREFVVGTGGAQTYWFEDIARFSQRRTAKAFGILELTLGDGSYDWRFVAAGTDSFRDSGSANCH